MATVHGLDGQTYEVQGPKPVEQALDDMWFLWIGNDANLKSHLEDLVVAEQINLSTATDEVKAYVDGYLEGIDDDGFLRNLAQICQSYTDWRHLAQRLCNLWSITVDVGR